MTNRFRTALALALGVGLAVAALPSVAFGSSSALPVLSAKLTGAGGVPKVSTKATGNIKVTLNAKTGQVCWTLTAVGLGVPQSTDIHQARVGKAGRSVVPLGAKFLKKGCVISPTKLVKNIVAKPAGYYVSVHTKKYPDGLIAGRLHR